MKTAGMRHLERLPKPRILAEKEAEWQDKYEEKRLGESVSGLFEL